MGKQSLIPRRTAGQELSFEFVLPAKSTGEEIEIILASISYNQGDQTLTFWNVNSMPLIFIYLGYTTKRDRPDLAGKFGDGAKAAALKLKALDKSVSIRAGCVLDNYYEMSFSLSGGKEHPGTRALYYKTNNEQGPFPTPQTSFQIANITREEWDSCINTFLCLRKIVRDDFVEVRTEISERVGSILFPKPMNNNEIKGCSYVQEILISKSTAGGNMTPYFGYNFENMPLNRDRKTISEERARENATSELHGYLLNNHERIIEDHSLIQNHPRIVLEDMGNCNNEYIRITHTFLTAGNRPGAKRLFNLFSAKYPGRQPTTNDAAVKSQLNSYRLNENFYEVAGVGNYAMYMLQQAREPAPDGRQLYYETLDERINYELTRFPVVPVPNEAEANVQRAQAIYRELIPPNLQPHELRFSEFSILLKYKPPREMVFYLSRDLFNADRCTESLAGLGQNTNPVVLKICLDVIKLSGMPYDKFVLHNIIHAMNNHP